MLTDQAEARRHLSQLVTKGLGCLQVNLYEESMERGARTVYGHVLDRFV